MIPSLRCISELARKSVYGLALGGLDKALDKALCRTPYGATDGFTLTLYFGHTEFEPLADLARQLFEAFPCPILLVEFRRQQGWHIEGVRPGVLNRLRSDQEDVFADALDGFSRRAWRMPRSRRVARYDMAILHDPDEALPPSNPQALANFVRVGASLGIDVELIGRKDYARLAEFDALLIRETTRVDHHTYRFAEKAEREGLVVMDDPASILRCTNKVYLADLLGCRQLGMPLTEILYKERPQDWQRVARRLGFPLVLKIPDGCFSRGVVKVNDDSELLAAASSCSSARSCCWPRSSSTPSTTGASACSTANRCTPASTSCRAATGRSTTTRPTARTSTASAAPCRWSRCRRRCWSWPWRPPG